MANPLRCCICLQQNNPTSRANTIVRGYAVCTQAGRKTPATWIVNKGQGTNSYFACTIHKDQLEKHGTAILRRKTKNAV